ncbi:Na(+)/H(+) antiporter subunit B [Thermococcus gammatolerans]|uniref:Membrane bound complex 2, subunit D (Mbc2D) n=1 Tax=Thermococcus gammatolerans (strain DSM 15229 / JCM 11827 / EJ3) TaxID=593117 RepID=C5A686_THEGJ|nr:Na(+)/H(+) antiporter subunit B [Thermococcus gammatolerans]ACS33748.1 Membrane bound complex 2, subunit D (Mbc2D) [Thermococcus gammatolerans EJ3]
MKRDVIVAVSFLLAFLFIAYAVAVKNVLGLGGVELRPLGEFYLSHSFAHEGLTSHSPEVVTAIVWNYRGFDTLFETFVFFLAIMGAFSVLRLTDEQEKLVKELEAREPHRHMDLIVRAITKLVVIMIIAISASIALHGHLTPGGGFQGGSAMAVASLLLFAAFSKFTLERKGLTVKHTVSAYALGLTLILATVLAPVFLYGGKVLEINLLPGEMGLFNLDVGEYLAVTFGFLTVFLVLGVSEWIFKTVLRGEVDD